MANNLFRNLESRRSDVDRHRENQSRPARSFAEFTSTGAGILIHDKVFSFGCAFMSRPTFTFGASLGDDVDLPDDPPRCHAFVHDWKMTADDYYSGAWCTFQVDTASVVNTSFVVIFHLAWEGLASKDFISSHGFPVNTLDVGDSTDSL